MSDRPATQWQLSAPASLPELQQLMDEYGVSAPVAQMVYARGLSRAALQPELRLTPNSQLREAAKRIVSAIKAHKRIRIHGDYDADGVSATATLVVGLRELGAEVHGFIPHRLNEGYGIHPTRVDEHAQAADLLVTVDCGVSNHEEVQSLLDKGVEVIITDHHSPSATFPATLVVHPQLTEHYDHDLHNLTGAGVAYHLLWAVREELGVTGEYASEPRHLSPLATLGTIADVAPLIGENRALVQAGLAQFARSELPGVQALMGGASVTARQVAFVLAPRINAAGRMGEAEAALELLTTTSPQRARALATFLDIKNKERREIQDQMFEEALQLADPSDAILVITAPHWHAGVMGIVASKLLEHYYKPVYIVAQGKGSVRSTPGISAVGGLRHASALLKRFGGHPGAAGFAMEERHFGALRSSLQEYARQFPTPVPRLNLDAALSPAHISMEMYQQLELFEPYGEGWRAPQWHLRAPAEVARLVGKKDPKTTLNFEVQGRKGVKFSQRSVPVGVQDMAAALDLNNFKGTVSLQLQLEGLRNAAPLQLAEQPSAQPTSELPAHPPLPRRLNAQQVRAYVAAHLGTVPPPACSISVYATGSAARNWWAEHFPAVKLLEGDSVLSDPTEVLLCALPPEDTLKRWLTSAQLIFAWGAPTLSILQSSTATDALSYWRWQWAQLYQVLDDASFGVAVYALLGLPLPQPQLDNPPPPSAGTAQT